MKITTLIEVLRNTLVNEGDIDVRACKVVLGNEEPFQIRGVTFYDDGDGGYMVLLGAITGGEYDR